MAHEVLVDEQIDAGADFARDFSDYAPVTAAFWINPDESDQWYLYVASDDINDNNIRDAYGVVSRKMGSGKYPWIDLMQIKLVNSSDPVAQAAVKIRDRRTAPIPTRYHGGSMGGLTIGDAYIYPPLPAAKPAP